MKFILGFIFTLFSLFGTVTVDGSLVILTNSPVALSSTSLKVNKVLVKIVPGQSCKVYVGKVGFSRSNLSGVFAVLYPNSTGGFSEEWSLQDPRAADGIDLSSIFVAGDCAGETITYMYFQTGMVASSLLRNYESGPKGGSSGTWQLSNQSQSASVLQVKIIPGNVGKINLLGGTQSCCIAILYPNTGNVNQNNAHSETFDLLDYFGNEHIRPYQMWMSANIASEQILASAWTVQ